MLENLSIGFHVAFSAVNLLYCFIGVFLGTLAGVLPGIGPAGAIALLLPLSYGMDPTSAIIMLAGIFYGSQYGGSITSILVNIPGEPSSVITSLDGYQMTLQGRAGPALGMSAFGSFIAGTIGIIIMMLVAQPLSTVVLKFGPPEYTSLMVLALTFLTYLSSGSVIKAVIMALFGLGLSQMGMDVVTGDTRFTFGILDLQDGVGIVPLVMGLFGVSEVLVNLEKSFDQEIFNTKIKRLLPTLKDWRDSIAAIMRGTFIGFFLGLIPGAGVTVAPLVSYGTEKKFSKHPEKFGTGVIEGVAGPESANNAASSSNFIPLFILGIPCGGVTALLLGALMIHGLQPGPILITQNPGIFWGTIVSMYIGNVFLLILNLPLVGLWVKLLKIPYRILFPLILFFCIIGSYSLANSTFDVLVMIVFGVIGYLLQKFDYQPAPLIMGFVLGDLFEKSLRQSLLMSSGDPSIFFTRPVSVSCLIIALLLLLSPIFLRKYRPM
jgi:putative tricarboxylic transport membrane protein